jgi:S1-C subfamily serine protease
MQTRISIFFFLLMQFSVSLGQTPNSKNFTCNKSGCQIIENTNIKGISFEWSGGCKSGLADGDGVLLCKVGDTLLYSYYGTCVSGIRKGMGKLIYPDSSILECSFENGLPIGKATFLSADGDRYEGDFFHFNYHGKGVFYYSNGSKFEGTFANSEIHTGTFTNYDGKVTYYYRSEEVEKMPQVANYEMPPTGVRTIEYFDIDWKRCEKSRAAYYRHVTFDAPFKPRGVVKDYYISGNLQEEYNLLYLDNDDPAMNFRHGSSKFYYENGNLQKQVNYQSNKLSGDYSSYFEDGKLELQTSYENGLLNGIYRAYYESGAPRFYALYEMGLPVSGKFVEYDKSGNASLLYRENFALNKDIWVQDNPSDKSYLGDYREVQMIKTGPEPLSRLTQIDVNQGYDFTIKSTILRYPSKEKGPYGLVYGYKDIQNHFMFLINTKGQYKIFGQIEGMPVELRDWNDSKAIKVGKEMQFNTLEIHNFEKKLYFIINDEIVDQFEFKPFKGDFYGFASYSKGAFALTELTVRERLPLDEIFKIVPLQYDSDDGWIGNGSGFFISSNGYIATNYHVIQDANDIQVEYYQKGTKCAHKAKVIVVDKQNDLAILQISDSTFKTLPKLPYSFSTNIKDVGSDVFALGYPLEDMMGSEIKFTDGKISSKTGAEGDVTCYQISVPLQPGNSGGPLFDSNGELIGVNSAIFNKEIYNSENVSYAIKSTYLKNLVDVLPEQISLPDAKDIKSLPLTEKIKVLSDFIPIIRIR